MEKKNTTKKTTTKKTTTKRPARKKAEPKKVAQPEGDFNLQEFVQPHLKEIWGEIIKAAKEKDLWAQKLIMEYVLTKPTKETKIDLTFKDFDITKLISFDDE